METRLFLPNVHCFTFYSSFFFFFFFSSDLDFRSCDARGSVRRKAKKGTRTEERRKTVDVKINNCSREKMESGRKKVVTMFSVLIRPALYSVHTPPLSFSFFLTLKKERIIQKLNGDERKDPFF